MSATERAAEIIEQTYNSINSPELAADALAAADPPLLITPEIQAVLDAVVGYWLCNPDAGIDEPADDEQRVIEAVNAYLASRGET